MKPSTIILTSQHPPDTLLTSISIKVFCTRLLSFPSAEDLRLEVASPETSIERIDIGYL